MNDVWMFWTKWHIKMTYRPFKSIRYPRHHICHIRKYIERRQSTCIVHKLCKMWLEIFGVFSKRWACVGWKHGCDFKQMKLFRGADRGVFLKLKVLMITDARLEITQFSEIMTPQFIRGKTNANEGRKTSVIMIRMVSWGRSCRGERRKHRS